MRITAVIISLVLFSNLAFAITEITPYKFSDDEYNSKKFPKYSIPDESTFSIARNQKDKPDVIYYFSKPKQQQAFPITILCGGSEKKEGIASIIHFHRYFLKEFLDLGSGLITVERLGVSGDQVNEEEFINHYTRSQRLIDHKTVINHLIENPPVGWNGKFIFVGVSEGGPLVTALTAKYANITLATVNWSGAGDWNWREELWAFLQGLSDEVLLSIPPDIYLPRTKEEFDEIMNQTLADPKPTKEFMGMSYMYHADSLNWPKTPYMHITTPYLVVAGENDALIDSIDAFVKKAVEAGVQVSYLRVSNMDHYVRKREDILVKSFEWLRKFINHSP